MSTYRAPLRDMQFVLNELAGIDELAKLPGYEESADVVDAILEEAGTFATEVLDPINHSGDKEGCTWRDGVVTTPKGFKEAYAQFAKAGWIGLPVDPEYGGQGLPQLILGPTLEMWNGANVGFANGPLLNQGAIEAIVLTGSHAQKQMFIPKLVSGEWTGTMCLTEPQAGSDLAAVRTSAVPRRRPLSHQRPEDLHHVRRARPGAEHRAPRPREASPDAPERDEGHLDVHRAEILGETLTERWANATTCTARRSSTRSASTRIPTCTLNYGEKTGGAIGYLVGEPHRGLEYMFIMMNAARFSVGVQGLAIADRAYQSALAYAKERVQSRDIKDSASRGAQAVTIFHHPDVRRMLMWMKSQIEAMRALAYVTAASLDLSNKSPDEAVRKEHRAFVEFMIPIVKGWCTEAAIDICSTALQVFGGMGFIEETGIAQQYRDVRITAIYEGTTGIQALDLVGRKLIRDMGTTATRSSRRIKAFAAELASVDDPDVKAIHGRARARHRRARDDVASDRHERDE